MLFPILENQELIDNISMFVDGVIEVKKEVTAENLAEKGLIKTSQNLKNQARKNK